MTPEARLVQNRRCGRIEVVFEAAAEVGDLLKAQADGGLLDRKSGSKEVVRFLHANAGDEIAEFLAVSFHDVPLKVPHRETTS